MTSIRVKGVPEHFNLPWHQAIESGVFENAGLKLEWVTEPGGTGAMCRSLREEEVDCCVLLTEGVIADIIKGNPSRIISGYVVSPLIWGVHTGAKNELSDYEDSFSRQYAISRFGSGSHLMPQVDALTKDLAIPSEQFTVVGGLKGALESLEAGDTDVFYWEKYTTKPYVDSGQLRRIGEFVTPWPCFVIAATEKAIAEKPEALRSMLEIIHQQNRKFMEDEEHSINLVAQRYEQKLKDVQRWFHSTVWADHSMINPQTIQNVLYCLNETGIIDDGQVYEKLIWKP